MNNRHVFSLVVVGLLLAGAIWLLPQHGIHQPIGTDEQVPAAAIDEKFAIAETDVLQYVSPRETQSLSMDELRNYPGRWNAAARAQIISMPPKELLEFLDDDEILVREDGRDLVLEVYQACGVKVAASVVPVDGSGDTWCDRLLADADGKLVWERIKMLMDLIEHAEPSELWQGERAELRAIEAAQRGDDSLAALVLDDDVMQVIAALEVMHEARNTDVISDWGGFDALDEAQKDVVWTTLWMGLNCQSTGDCSPRSLPLASICSWPAFQCDAGNDYYSVIRRSLSPAQIDALLGMMRGVYDYRRQHDD